MSEALPLLYRPKKFSEMFGNTAVIKSIQTLLDRKIEGVPSAWLFTGPSGTGKTTLARIIANELGCDPSSFFEMNASSERGIDAIRTMSANSRLSALSGSIKVYLLDECHSLTPPSMEALLKVLEDSPKNTFFFLATTNPEKLIRPIKSRCHTVQVSPLTTKQIALLLKSVIEKEGIDLSDFPNEVIAAIGKNCNGAARDALKLLDAVIDMDDVDEMLSAVNVGVASEGTLKELCQLLMEKRKKPWKEVATILKGLSEDPETTRRGVCGYLNAVILNSGDLRIAEIAECFERNYYDSGKLGLTLSCLQAAQL